MGGHLQPTHRLPRAFPAPGAPIRPASPTPLLASPAPAPVGPVGGGTWARGTGRTPKSGGRARWLWLSWPLSSLAGWASRDLHAGMASLEAHSTRHGGGGPSGRAAYGAAMV